MQAKIITIEGVYPQNNLFLNKNYTSNKLSRWVTQPYDGFLIWQKIIWQIIRKVAITIYK